MKQDKKRDQKLKGNIAKGEKEVSLIARRGRRTVKGIVSEFTDSAKFAINARFRDSMYAELAKEYAKFGSDIDEWTKNSIEKTARDFWGYAKTDLPIKGTFNAFSEKYIADIIGEINPAAMGDIVGINAQVGGMLQNDIRALRAAVSTTIAEGSVEGLNNKELADRMRKKVNKVAGEFVFTDRAGKRWSAENYFGMLNRTINANAARNTYAKAGTDAGFDVYVIGGGVTGSSVENPDDPCDSWAGKPFSMTGTTKGLPTYDDVLAAGVFHPNCVHYVRAATPSEVKAATS